MSLVQVDSIEGRSGTTITIPAGQTLAVAGTFTTSGTVTVTAGGIGTTELADDAVTAAKIADDAVVQAAIGDDAVGADQLASSAVVTASIVDANVTLAKIENLAANTVLVRDASSSGVASAKAVADTQILIGDGTGFTAAALSSDVTMANTGAVTIANNAITNAKVADDAIGLAELSATGTASSSTFLRGDNSWASAGGTNVPRFAVFADADWDPANDTWVLHPFDTADINDDGASGTCFNLTSSGTNPRGFTVPANQAGVYLLTYTTTHYVIAGAMEAQNAVIQKGVSGGSPSDYIGYTWFDDASNSDYVTLSWTGLVNAAVGDHYYVYNKNACGDTNGRIKGGRLRSHFSGFKLL